MKKTFILVITLVMSVATFAQQLATLNHNDSITVFYGMNALQQAHASAVNGDIITLSPGIFNSVDITKAVTIRGAGAWADTNGNSNTIIYNETALTIPNDATHHLTMEGLYFMNNVVYITVYNPQFYKCHLHGLNYGSNVTTMQNANITNCIVENFSNCYINSQWVAQGSQFYNSVILNISDVGGNSLNTHGPASFINCVLSQNPQLMASRLFQNCILYWSWQYSGSPSGSGSNAFNCMYINTGYSANLFSDIAGHVLWNKSSMSSVFKNFNGGVGSTTTFELQDSIVSNYLGMDGTQIGIYGGLHPFSPKVTSPVIKSINVAQRNNSEGKLEVNIEMVSEDE